MLPRVHLSGVDNVVIAALSSARRRHMGFGYTRKWQKCTFLRCLRLKFQPFISAMVKIVGRSTFGNVAGSAPVSLAVVCTVCGALSKLAMLMCMAIRIGQNSRRNLLILCAQGYTFEEISPRQYAPRYTLGFPLKHFVMRPLLTNLPKAG